MSTNPLIASFAGVPALVEPAQLARFEACLHAVVTHEHAAVMLNGAEMSSSEDFWATEDDSWMARLRPYTVVDGVLQIPVKGVLLHNFPYALFDWATGYEYIWQAFKRGCGDYATGTIKGIALVQDTPGGMVAGCFDAVDKMVALKTAVGVPVRAFAHESAYSAGYAVATVADHIVVSRTGGVGSIGVVTGHLDVSGAMEKAGLKFTYIASDPSKVEGNRYEALSDDAKARIQARIDELYSIFVAAVARSRGLDESAIRGDLKAYCYTATQAVSNGLADSVGSFEDATAAFAVFLDDESDEGEDEMTTPNTAVDQAANDAAVAAARNEGAVAMQTRISAIMNCEEAKGRESLANHFAFNTQMSPEDAAAALKASPVAAAPVETKPEPDAAATTFTNAMDKTKNPDVKTDGDDAKVDDGSDTVALARSLGIHGVRAAAQ